MSVMRPAARSSSRLGQACCLDSGNSSIFKCLCLILALLHCEKCAGEKSSQLRQTRESGLSDAGDNVPSKTALSLLANSASASL